MSQQSGYGNNASDDQAAAAQAAAAAQIDPMLVAGNFSGAFQTAEAENDSPTGSGYALEDLLNPIALSESGVQWDQQSLDAYYQALAANTQTIDPSFAGIIGQQAPSYNAQVDRANGGTGTFDAQKSTFGTSASDLSAAEAKNEAAVGYIPDPYYADFNPYFQTSGMGGALGDINNAFSEVAPIVGDAALVAAAGIATGGAVSAAAGGGIAGAAAGGAAAGAASTIAGDAINGTNLTLSQLGKGILEGGITGGIGYETGAATGILSNNISTDTGLSTSASDTLSSGIVKVGATLATDKIGSAITSAFGSGSSGTANSTGSASTPAAAAPTTTAPPATPSSTPSASTSTATSTGTTSGKPAVNAPTLANSTTATGTPATAPISGSLSTSTTDPSSRNYQSFQGTGSWFTSGVGG